LFAGSLHRTLLAPYACESVYRSPEESKMQDEDRTKEQLITELRALRQRLAESEKDKAERKWAEQALQESQQMLQCVLDTIPARVFWKNCDSSYLGCNRPFALDAGLQSPDEIVGRNDFEMGWSEQAELYRSDDRLVIETRKPKLGYEEPQTTPSGEKIWLRTSKVPLFDVNGEIKGVLGTYEDITVHKQAEEALRESEELYRTLVNLSPDAISVADMNGLLTFTSPKALQIFGDSPDDEILGRSILSWVAPEEHEKVSANIQLLSTEKTLAATEYTLTSVHPETSIVLI
jgi:PAS domain S-box-containing protein